MKLEDQTLYRTRAYAHYRRMIRACYHLQDPLFKLFGAYGTRVYRPWLKGGFEAFLRDMGQPPERRMSLVLRDPKGDFSKANCYWGYRAERNLATPAIANDKYYPVMHTWSRQLLWQHRKMDAGLCRQCGNRPMKEAGVCGWCRKSALARRKQIVDVRDVVKIMKANDERKRNAGNGGA